MLNKVALLAFVAPLVAGLTLTIPQNPTSGGSITIQWTTAAGDPTTFSIELLNPSFNNAFAIANNVPTSAGQITLNLPIVPVGSGYTLEAVDIGNINLVYASTGSFSIGATSTSSTSSTGTTTGTSTTATLTSPTTTLSVTTSSGLGTTVSTTRTTSTGSSSGTTSGTGSSSPATTSNAAMAPLKINSNIGSVAAVLFSVIAGAAIIAL